MPVKCEFESFFGGFLSKITFRLSKSHRWCEKFPIWLWKASETWNTSTQLTTKAFSARVCLSIFRFWKWWVEGKATQSHVWTYRFTHSWTVSLGWMCLLGDIITIWEHVEVRHKALSSHDCSAVNVQYNMKWKLCSKSSWLCLVQTVNDFKVTSPRQTRHISRKERSWVNFAVRCLS